MRNCSATSYFTVLVFLLLVEDNYDPLFERVQTGGAMKAALDHDAWDLVVSDYSMPQFDAPRALGLLRDCGLDTPFIVVSGTIGEDTAVATLLAGAPTIRRSPPRCKPLSGRTFA